jgi:hypothetical protein
LVRDQIRDNWLRVRGPPVGLPQQKISKLGLKPFQTGQRPAWIGGRARRADHGTSRTQVEVGPRVGRAQGRASRDGYPRGSSTYFGVTELEVVEVHDGGGALEGRVGRAGKGVGRMLLVVLLLEVGGVASSPDRGRVPRPGTGEPQRRRASNGVLLGDGELDPAQKLWKRLVLAGTARGERPRHPAPRGCPVRDPTGPVPRRSSPGYSKRPAACPTEAQHVANGAPGLHLELEEGNYSMHHLLVRLVLRLPSIAVRQRLPLGRWPGLAGWAGR